jgi:enoyl-CoA hydratase/carnithine racemase
MRYLPGYPHHFHVNRNLLADYKRNHLFYETDEQVAAVTLNRPERKNPLPLDSYAELNDLLRCMSDAEDIKVLILTGAGENFCSGGDVHEIIRP